MDAVLQLDKELHHKKNNLVIINGLKSWIIRIYFRVQMLLLIFAKTKSIKKVKFIINELKTLRSYYFGKSYVSKFIKIDNQYYFHLHAPGLPSKIMNNYLDSEIDNVLKNTNSYIRTAIMAITRKCPLNCEHCLEGNNIDGKEYLSLEQLESIIEKLQKNGVAQIQLSGGEPMTRFEDMQYLIDKYHTNSEFILLTSGYNLTYENAIKLKNAGLKQLTVALDSFDSEINNKIKGHPKAFAWAINAIENAHKANLLVSLSLCATNQFVTEENILNYMNFAKQLGVAFVHILEPQMLGNYENKQKYLSQKQEQILENNFLKMNYDAEFKEYPIIIYAGYHQRKKGCFGAANRYLYIDTKGNIQACPFCQDEGLDIFKYPLDTAIDNIRAKGCHKYETIEV